MKEDELYDRKEGLGKKLDNEWQNSGYELMPIIVKRGEGTGWLSAVRI